MAPRFPISEQLARLLDPTDPSLYRELRDRGVINERNDELLHAARRQHPANGTRC